MPNYKTLTLPPALYPGDSYTVINGETPASGTASERVALAAHEDNAHAPKLSVSVSFAGAPGAFEIDVQLSDSDSDQAFVAETTTITAVNANNQARLEFPNTVVGRFARLYTKTANANSVPCTATITR